MTAHLERRIEGIRSHLLACYEESSLASSSSKGQEREVFVREFLAKMFPPIFRFGSGEVTDSAGNRSGQLDVVIEYPFLPSLPAIAGSTRLYLAEGVASVVEVKSDISNQWNEVERTAKSLRTVRRNEATGGMFEDDVIDLADIPLFAVGYHGFKTDEPLIDRVLSDNGVDAILQVDEFAFVSLWDYNPKSGSGPQVVRGPKAFWKFTTTLYRMISNIQAATFDMNVYLDDQIPK